MPAEDGAKEASVHAPMGRLAFVVQEKVATSHDALNERWVPFAGPIDPADPNTRYAVFVWAVYLQRWERDGDGGFYDATLAAARASEAEKEVTLEWGLDA